MEDDLEEMRRLRERRKNQIKNSPKSKVKCQEIEEEEEKRDTLKNTKEADEMSQVMGFSGFGKKARTFDVNALFEQTRRAASQFSKKSISDHLEDPKQSSAKQPSSVEHLDRTSKSDDSDSDQDLIGPPLALISLPKDDEVEEEENAGDNETENIVDRYSVIPDSHEIELQHGSKVVSALTLDPNGARLLTGGYDFDLKFWDFSGMDSSLQSFRSLQPCECHPILNLEYSSTGDSILVVAGSCQAKVLDRDGFQLMECVKGDQYITDMANTKGHVSMLYDGCWHPREREEFLTCSNDGTLRIWFVNNTKGHSHVMKPRQQNGRKTAPTACRYSRDGNLVAAACRDGSIQMWDHRKNYVNTAFLVRGAHRNENDISSLSFSFDGIHVASRGCDETLKLWDLRKLKQPLGTANDLFNLFSMTDCAFSPDDRYILTGVSVKRGETSGRLVFLEKDTLKISYQVEVQNASVVRCAWHPKLNQIVVGTSSGAVKVYYNPDISERGAKLCVIRSKKKVKEAEMISKQQIITPHALPMFREDRPRSVRKKQEKDRKDPVKSHRPDLPVTGPGQGGRIASAGNTLSSFIVRNLGIQKKVDDNVDPREAILKYAKEAAENPYWVTPAYKQTQPQPVFQKENEEVEEEPSAKKPKLPI